MVMLYVATLLLLEGLCWARPESPLYSYPVAGYEAQGNSHLLVLNQWSLEELELYDWNSKTGQVNKLLMACYMPANVTLLPDGSGFSFVDNGRIRIKRFEKRAVKTLDIYEPIYGIEVIRWLDAQTCYFHALSDGRYGIYSLTLDEELKTLLACHETDFLYPCIMHETLFFIECRTDSKKHNIYTIGSCSLAASGQKRDTLVAFSSNPLCLLHMETNQEGFVVECNKQIGLCTFYYHHLVKKGSFWRHNLLFSFTVPRDFFIEGPGRIYESLLPLEPRVIGDKIYFSSHNEQTGYLDLYRFFMQDGYIERIACDSGHIFPPQFGSCQGWAGGSKFPFLRITI